MKFFTFHVRRCVVVLWCSFPSIVYGVEKSTASTQAIGSILQVFIGLLAVLVVIILAAVYLKKSVHLQLSGSGVIKLLSSISLSPRERVVLLQVGDEQILVGLSSAGVRTLHVLAHPVKIEIEAAQSDRGSNVINLLIERLSGFLQRKARP